MRFEVKQEVWKEDKDEWVEEEKVLKMPDKLKGGVGDTASEKLNAKINIDRKPNSSREGGDNVSASTQVSSSDFKEVKAYILERMIGKYNRGDSVEVDELTEESKNKVARHYYDQLDPFGLEEKKS